MSASMKGRRPEDVIGEWGIRDVTPPSQKERRALEAELDLNPLAGKPLRRRLRNFVAEPDSYFASLGGPLPYMRRLREIERETDRHLDELAAAYEEHRHDPAAWRLVAERWDFGVGQRADREAQPLVSGRGPAADEPADAGLRRGRWQAVPARAARRGVDPRQVPGRRLTTLHRRWPTTTITTTITSTITRPTRSCRTKPRPRLVAASRSPRSANTAILRCA